MSRRKMTKAERLEQKRDALSENKRKLQQAKQEFVNKIGGMTDEEFEAYRQNLHQMIEDLRQTIPQKHVSYEACRYSVGTITIRAGQKQVKKFTKNTKYKEEEARRINKVIHEYEVELCKAKKIRSNMN